MGSGRDKRKKAKEKAEGPLPGKGADKTEKKTKKNEEKAERRAEKKLAGDEDDIDALLAKFAIADKAKKSVTIEADCPPPSGRVNASFTPYVAPKINDIVLFGGECCSLTTGKVYVYNDLYRFSCDKRKWTRITTPSGPAPRSAHQGAVYKGCLYVFGGEFTSPNQERFHHYKELWRLDLTTYEWDMLPSKGGPSARSGHRMVAHKNRLLLYGGFYDTGRELKYYNDLWSFDFESLKWSPVNDSGSGGGSGSGQRPSPRSGCQLALHGDVLYLYGGYSKAKDEEDPDLEHGRVCDDMWALDLGTCQWEKIKKVGMAPGPRASFSLATHRGRAFLFGGASDNEAKGGEDLSSEFHNDLYQFNFEKRRWFAAEVRPGKGSAKTAAAAEADVAAAAAAADGGPSTSGGGAPEGATPEMTAMLAAGKDKNSALYRAAVRIQANFRGYVVRKAYKLYKIGGVVSEILYSPAAFGLDLSVKNMPKPRGRISALTAVVGNSLWLAGGIVEIGSKEITLDDMWCLDLVKLDGWDCVKGNTVGEEMFAADGSSDYETDSGGEGDDA